jgi:hypothetical protein
MTAFRVALYDGERELVKTYVGRPLWDSPTAQQTADMVARSAEAGCSYREGLVAVWAAPDLEPPTQLGADAPMDAACAFGGDRPPVPAYRWHRDGDWVTTLTPAE